MTGSWSRPRSAIFNGHTVVLAPQFQKFLQHTPQGYVQINTAENAKRLRPPRLELGPRAASVTNEWEARILPLNYER